MVQIIVSAAQMGKSCPYCRFPLKGGSEAMACDRCGAIHHLDCWTEGEGCAVVGCIADDSPTETSQLAPLDRSRKIIPVPKSLTPQLQSGTQSVANAGESTGGGTGRAVLIGLSCGLVIVLLGLGALFLTQGSNSDDADSESGEQAPQKVSLESPDTKPKIEVPDGPPPTTLQTKDITEGEGPGAKDGDQLSMQYVGALYSNGKEFDASWDRGQPFDFQLGGGQVIPGWDQGIVGMKAGGRRELIIPPDLGYGAQGSPPSIPGNATLIFVVDLISIR